MLNLNALGRLKIKRSRPMADYLYILSHKIKISETLMFTATNVIRGRVKTETKRINEIALGFFTRRVCLRLGGFFSARPFAKRRKVSFEIDLSQKIIHLNATCGVRFVRYSFFIRVSTRKRKTSM